MPFLKQSVTYAGAKRSTQKTAGIIPTISATWMTRYAWPMLFILLVLLVASWWCCCCCSCSCCRSFLCCCWALAAVSIRFHRRRPQLPLWMASNSIILTWIIVRVRWMDNYEFIMFNFWTDIFCSFFRSPNLRLCFIAIGNIC